MTEKAQDTIKRRKLEGNPESNRPWKDYRKPVSTIVGVKSLKKKFARRMEEARTAKLTKIEERQMKADKKEERQAEIERRKERERRREENRKKAEIVQKVSTAKVKRMNRKQLRQLRKRAHDE
eukprot:Clim_evm11s219 gene=Clim_evmTU11s219